MPPLEATRNVPSVNQQVLSQDQRACARVHLPQHEAVLGICAIARGGLGLLPPLLCGIHTSRPWMRRKNLGRGAFFPKQADGRWISTVRQYLTAGLHGCKKTDGVT
jgi:hypothetical protein